MLKLPKIRSVEWVCLICSAKNKVTIAAAGCPLPEFVGDDCCGTCLTPHSIEPEFKLLEISVETEIKESKNG